MNTNQTTDFINGMKHMKDLTEQQIDELLKVIPMVSERPNYMSGWREALIEIKKTLNEKSIK